MRRNDRLSPWACQRALIALAERQRDQIRKHIDELTEIAPTFDGPWPAELDLARLAAEARDTSETLELCRAHLGRADASLAIVAMAALMDMIEILKRTADTIQDRRCDLAVHTPLEGMFEEGKG